MGEYGSWRQWKRRIGKEPERAVANARCCPDHAFKNPPCDQCVEARDDLLAQFREHGIGGGGDCPHEEAARRAAGV